MAQEESILRQQYFRDSLKSAIWLESADGKYLSTAFPFHSDANRKFNALHLDPSGKEEAIAPILLPEWIQKKTATKLLWFKNGDQDIYFQRDDKHLATTRVMIDSTSPLSSTVKTLPNETLPEGLRGNEARLWMIIANRIKDADEKRVTFTLPEDAYKPLHDYLSNHQEKSSATHTYWFSKKPGLGVKEIDLKTLTDRMLRGSELNAAGKVSSEVSLSPHSSIEAKTFRVTMEREVFDEAFGNQLITELQKLKAQSPEMAK